MDDELPRLYVPTTENERAHSRDGSLDRLLDQQPRFYQQDSPQARRDSQTLPPEPLHHPDYRDIVHDPRPVQHYDPPLPPQPQLLDQEPPHQFNPPEQTSGSGYAPLQRQGELWRPFWLRELVLAGFILLFVILLIALIILRSYAKNDNGFAVSNSVSHLAWSYAPTAVLVILVALWRQVDHHTKAIAPWAELQSGPVIASQSLLLDYVSPLQFSALLKASKNGHWAVFASVCGFAMLKLMTIFATGLLIVLPDNMADPNILERRLRLSPDSLWLLVAGFIILILLTVVVIFANPRAVVSTDPSTIAANAAILTRSNDLQWLLQRYGISRHMRQKAVLAGFMFQTSHKNGPFKILMEGSELRVAPPSSTAPEDLKWWRPFTLAIPFLGAMLLFPIILIIVLELLQHRSDTHQGLFNLPSNVTSLAYSHYIPAIVMLLIAATFNTLDFNASLFAPFAALRKGDSPAAQSLTANLVGKLPPMALLSSFRGLHFGAGLAILAAMIASILTILVSGLYTVQNFDSTSSRTLTRLSTFTAVWPNSVSSDSGAASALSISEHNPSQPYAAFTYDNLVFPEFSFGDYNPPLSNLATVGDTRKAVIPALRANLKCTVHPSTSFSLASLGRTGPGNPAQAYVTVQADLPSSCQLGGYYGNYSYFVYQNAFEIPEDGSEIYAGQQLDLLFGKNASQNTNAGERYYNYIEDSPAVGCPSLAFTFGKFKLHGTDKDAITTMVCYQQLENVNTNITFQNDTTKFNTTVPPRPDENSVTLVRNPRAAIKAGMDKFEWRIQRHFTTEMGGFKENGVSFSSIDHFFQAIIAGREKVQPQDLVGKANQQRLVQSITKLYQRYMVQVMDKVMRQSTSPSKLHSRDTATGTGSLGSAPATVSTPRLVQDKTSKKALQVLLGLMVAFGVLALIFTRMRKVVPVNICTIAGMMGLLAGSDLCFSRELLVCECCGKPRTNPDEADEADENAVKSREPVFPEGAEWMSTASFERRFKSTRMRFSLGWWRERVSAEGVQERPRRYGVDVGIRADGSDDQEWELGQRGGGVEERGLGWAGGHTGNNDDGPGPRPPMQMSGGIGGPGPADPNGGLAPAPAPSGLIPAALGPAAETAFQRFRSLRGSFPFPGSGAATTNPRLYAHAETEDDDDDAEADKAHLRRASDGRQVRWGEDQVRIYDRQSEDAASSIYRDSIGSAGEFAETSFRRRTEGDGNGLGGRFGGEA